MNDSILKKYSSPVKKTESSSKPCIILRGDNVRFDTTHTTIVENENYKMEARYTDGKIVYLNVTTPQAHFTLYDINNKSFFYSIPSDSDLEKLGIGGFYVSSKVSKPEDIEKFCGLKQRISRFFSDIRTTVVKINQDFLSDSPNKTWLQKHNLYDKFVDVQALLDSLSELCLGNQITEKQLISLMETGELFRSEEERVAYAQKVAELQRNIIELDGKINDSFDLQNSLQSQLEKAKEQKTSLQSNKTSLYDNFIRDEEI